MTPLQMAMVAGAIGNGGVVMKPFLLDQVVSPAGRTVVTTKAQELGRAVSRETAAAVTPGMVAAARWPMWPTGSTALHPRVSGGRSVPC